MRKPKFQIGDRVKFNANTPKWFQEDYSPNVIGVIVERDANGYHVEMQSAHKEKIIFKAHQIEKIN